jgi:LDH2 family malate/lactate/ureidoglycolate dehydrogenase
VAAIDVARFVGLDVFKAQADRHFASLRASKRLPGVDSIRLPGDRRRECRAERLRDGVPVPAALLAQLDAVADELGVRRLRER